MGRSWGLVYDGHFSDVVEAFLEVQAGVVEILLLLGGSSRDINIL